MNWNRLQQIAPTFAAAPDDVRLAIYDATTNDQHLYFIKSRHKVKIGIARDPLKRLHNMQGGSPTKLELLFVLPYGAILEQDLHQKFKEFHSHGEWFKLAPAIKDFIKQITEHTNEIGIKWDSKTNRIVDLNQKTVSWQSRKQTLANLQRINGKTHPSNTTL